eukprot:350769_1
MTDFIPRIKVMIILLGVTTCILITFFIISIQQICITKMNEKQRLRRAFRTAFFNISSIMLNTLQYLSYLNPHCILLPRTHLNIQKARDIFEAFLIITGFHIFRIFSLSIIDRLYAPINRKRPKWIQLFYIFLEIFIIIMVLIFYGIMPLISPEIQWTKIFYIILGVVVMIEAFIIYFILKQIFNILKCIKITENNTKSIQIWKAKRAIQGAMFTVLVVVMVDIVAIIFVLEMINDFFGISFNKSLLDCIDHSMFCIVLSGALILWIYRGNQCCTVYENSICIYYGCGEFWWYACDCCCNGLDEEKQIKKVRDKYQRKITKTQHEAPVFLLQQEELMSDSASLSDLRIENLHASNPSLQNKIV